MFQGSHALLLIKTAISANIRVGANEE
jgi:hypothetical protein